MALSWPEIAPRHNDCIIHICPFQKHFLIQLNWFFHGCVVGKGEYCQLESFNATCADDEIIIMLSAHYGRMRSGRCITRNYGNLGCSADVLPYLDKQCSGKSKCVISIPDPKLHKSRPCPRDFTAYLEASYQCVRGECPHFVLYNKLEMTFLSILVSSASHF